MFQHKLESFTVLVSIRRQSLAV